MSTTGLIPVTAYSRAERYVGQVLEVAGSKDHPLIQWWLSLCGFGLDAHDEIAWCSAMVNGICWDLRLPRSNNAMARSWLDIGRPINIFEAKQGFDIVVLRRGAPPHGHVGFFSGMDGAHGVSLLGGNQGNKVSVQTFERGDVLGVRRLREWA